MRWAEIERMKGAPSYRQMDHWTSAGLLVADRDRPGTGRSREWTATQVAHAMRIKALSDLGVRLAVVQDILAIDNCRFEGGLALYEWTDDTTGITIIIH